MQRGMLPLLQEFIFIKTDPELKPQGCMKDAFCKIVSNLSKLFGANIGETSTPLFHAFYIL